MNSHKKEILIDVIAVVVITVVWNVIPIKLHWSIFFMTMIIARVLIDMGKLTPRFKAAMKPKEKNKRIRLSKLSKKLK